MGEVWSAYEAALSGICGFIYVLNVRNRASFSGPRPLQTEFLNESRPDSSEENAEPESEELVIVSLTTVCV